MVRSLTIDDDIQMREMLKQMLELAGYEVMCAPDGKVEMQLFRKETAALVIINIIMPESVLLTDFWLYAQYRLLPSH